VSVLRAQDVIVSQDAGVFELIAAWGRSPSATATAQIRSYADTALTEALVRQTQVASSTTSPACA
jgi:hypothetical protein